MTDPALSKLHEVCAKLGSGRPIATGIDPEVFGAAIGDLIRESIDPLADRIRQLEARLNQLQISTIDGANNA